MFPKDPNESLRCYYEILHKTVPCTRISAVQIGASAQLCASATYRPMHRKYLESPCGEEYSRSKDSIGIDWVCVSYKIDCLDRRTHPC